MREQSCGRVWDHARATETVPTASAGRMKRAILPAAISDPVVCSPRVADGDSPRPKVESSREGDDAARLSWAERDGHQRSTTA